MVTNGLQLKYLYFFNFYKILMIYSIILLNNKHTVKEFQDEIDKIVEEKYEEINLYGDDWEIVKKYINKKFDWIELNYNNEFLQI